MNEVDLAFIRKVRNTIYNFYVSVHSFRSMEFDWVTHANKITSENWDDNLGITYQEFITALQTIQSINTALNANNSELIKALWRVREVQWN